MSKVSTFLNLLKEPQKTILPMARNGFLNWMSDEALIKCAYKSVFGYDLNLNHPKTFNEKLQWLKLYDRRPEYTMMVDKYRVREYIQNKIGAEFLIPLLGVWDSVQEVDFNALPEQFVLKCNHDQGSVIICKDKSWLDVEAAKRKLKAHLGKNHYCSSREWPYKNVTPRILAEQYLSNGEGGLTDYKVHCFNGIPKLILVCKGRLASSGPTYDFYSTEWEPLDIRRPSHPNSAHGMPKPAELAEMLSLSERLAKDIPFLRTDFYIVDHKIYFSELTFFPASGLDRFVPEEWDGILGSWLVLPNSDRSLNTW